MVQSLRFDEFFLPVKVHLIDHMIEYRLFPECFIFDIDLHEDELVKQGMREGDIVLLR